MNKTLPALPGKAPALLPGAFEIVGRIHGSEDVVGGNLAIKRVGQPLKSSLADG